MSEDKEPYLTRFDPAPVGFWDAVQRCSVAWGHLAEAVRLSRDPTVAEMVAATIEELAETVRSGGKS